MQAGEDDHQKKQSQRWAEIGCLGALLIIGVLVVAGLCSSLLDDSDNCQDQFRADVRREAPSTLLFPDTFETEGLPIGEAYEDGTVTYLQVFSGANLAGLRTSYKATATYMIEDCQPLTGVIIFP